MAAADGGSAPQVNLNRWNLTKETELRIEVADTAPAYVKVSAVRCKFNAFA